MKNFFLFILEISKIVALALLVVLPIRYFVFQPFYVKGESMEPNFSNGDYLIIDEMSYRLREPARGQVIVFRYPNDPSQRYIKRIIGLPGETVEISDGQIIIYNEAGEKSILEESYLPDTILTNWSKKMALGLEEYFVLGDNRMASADSRRWGSLPRENIIGRALLRAWPPTALAKIEAPAY